MLRIQLSFIFNFEWHLYLKLIQSIQESASFVWCQVRGLRNLSRLLYGVLGGRSTSVNVEKKVTFLELNVIEKLLHKA